MLRRFLILLFLITPVVALSQDPRAKSYAPLTAQDRVRLIERLNLFVKYQVAQQWEKQYDLLSSLDRRAEGKLDFVNRTRQAYLKWGRKPLLQFKPFKAGLIQADANQELIFVVGCSELLDKDKKILEVTAIEAYKERNDWFFSELHTQAPEPGTDPCGEIPTPRIVASLQ